MRTKIDDKRITCFKTEQDLLDLTDLIKFSPIHKKNSVL